MKPTLHLVGIFHTQHTTEFSHCAFTGKALRFAKMMQFSGYNVIEYSNEGSQSTANEHVVMLSLGEFDTFFKARKKSDFHGDYAYVGSEAHSLFESRLVPALRERLKPQDIICHPFGHAHSRLLVDFPNNQHVETGIGYPTLMDKSFKIFESYAWMHYHQGRESRNGSHYEWVIPNYFDLDEWEPSYIVGNYIAFLGRICEVKGMDTVLEIARRSPYPVKIAGQGNPSQWSHPNIEYVGPLTGKQRSDFLRNARCAIMPTVFTEPFGGSGVEAMLCGTPLLAVDYGAFTETVIDGVTGFRCKTLEEWLQAIENCNSLDRKSIASITRNRYSLQKCSAMYDRAFSALNDLYAGGWYSCDGDSYDSALLKLKEKEVFFACIGAMDGKSHDHLFPHAYANKHWGGLLVEPVEEHFYNLRDNYDYRENLVFAQVAITETEGEREIYTVPPDSNLEGDEKLPEWVNGISTFYPDGGAFSQYLHLSAKEKVDCARFETLTRLHQIDQIDILQIDAEGYDFEIFSQVWNLGYRPLVICIEVVRMLESDQLSLRELLTVNGYRVKREGDNWVAISRDLK